MADMDSDDELVVNQDMDNSMNLDEGQGEYLVVIRYAYALDDSTCYGLSLCIRKKQFTSTSFTRSYFIKIFSGRRAASPRQPQIDYVAHFNSFVRGKCFRFKQVSVHSRVYTCLQL